MKFSIILSVLFLLLAALGNAQTPTVQKPEPAKPKITPVQSVKQVVPQQPSVKPNQGKKNDTTAPPKELKEMGNILEKSKDKELQESKKKEEDKRKKFIETLLQTFRYGTSTERGEALRRAENLKIKEEILQIKPGLEGILKDGSNKILVRKTIEVCAVLKLQDLAPLIGKFVHDDNEEVRRTAIASLARMQAKDAAGEIMKFLLKQDLSVNDNSTLAAVNALAELKHQPFGTYALNTIRREYPEISKDVAEVKAVAPEPKPDLKVAPSPNPPVKPGDAGKPKPVDAKPPQVDATKPDKKSPDKLPESPNVPGKTTNTVDTTKVDPGKPAQPTPPQPDASQSGKVNLPAQESLFWPKEKGQVLNSTVQGQLILGLGDLGYQSSGSMLLRLLQAGFHADEVAEDSEDGKKIDEAKKKLTQNLPLETQSYLINALGKMKLAEAKPILRQKLARIDGYFSDDRKKKYIGLYLQSLAALVRLGDDSVNEALVRSLKDDSPGIRLRSAKLISELRSPESVDILHYRLMHDENRKVRFAALQALMEMIEPGSTNEGVIVGTKLDSSTSAKAMQAVLKYLNPEENSGIVEAWVSYLGEHIPTDPVEKAIVTLIRKRTERFLPRNQQEQLIHSLTALITARLQKKKSLAPEAWKLLQELQNRKALRYAARAASRSVRQVNRLMEDLQIKPGEGKSEKKEKPTAGTQEAPKDGSKQSNPVAPVEKKASNPGNQAPVVKTPVNPQPKP